MQKGHKDNFALYKEAALWLNVPHRDGGLSVNGIDCSGLAYIIYKNVYGKTIERNSATILQKNCVRRWKSQLREGDLVFFNTAGTSKFRVNHVGIYLKDNKFLHSSTSRGVIVSSLEEDFFRKAWICGGRVRHYKWFKALRSEHFIYSYEHLCFYFIDIHIISLFITLVHKLFITTDKKACKAHIQYRIFATWVSTHNMKYYVERSLKYWYTKKSIVKYWTGAQSQTDILCKERTDYEVIDISNIVCASVQWAV